MLLVLTLKHLHKLNLGMYKAGGLAPLTSTFGQARDARPWCPAPAPATFLLHTTQHARTLTYNAPSLGSGNHTLLRQPSRVNVAQPILDDTRSFTDAQLREEDEPMQAEQLAPHLEALNAEQLAAARDFSSSAIGVTAGPGSGKTRLIVARVHELIEGDMKLPPEDIAVITFTVKAAGELKNRLKPLLERTASKEGVGDQSMFVGTFHSFCQRFLERYGRALDPSLKDRTILSENDQQKVIKAAVRKVVGSNMPPQDLAHAVKQFSEKVSVLKGQLSTAHQLQGRQNIEAAIEEMQKQQPHQAFNDMDVQQFADVYDEYTARLSENQSMDYDDLLSFTSSLMSRGDTQAVQQFKRVFKHVLVDEFQDTNSPQYSILKGMHSAGTNIFVVGDPAQAIYGWRGAQPDNMVRAWSQDFPGATMHLLMRNHRSLPAILYAAALINQQHKTDTKLAPSPSAFPSTLHDGPLSLATFRGADSDGQRQGKVSVVTCGTARDEAAWVASRIHKLCCGDGVNNIPLGNVAVLFRTNRQSVLLEEALHSKDIRFVLPKRERFWTSPEVLDLLHFVTMAHPGSAAALSTNSLRRLMTRPYRRVEGASRMFDLLLQAERNSDGEFSAGRAMFGDIPTDFKDFKLPPEASFKEVEALIQELRVMEAEAGRGGQNEGGGGKRSIKQAGKKPTDYANSLWRKIVNDEEFPPTLSLAPRCKHLKGVLDALQLHDQDPEADAIRFCRDLIALMRYSMHHFNLGPALLLRLVHTAVGYTEWLEERLKLGDETLDFELSVKRVEDLVESAANSFHSSSQSSSTEGTTPPFGSAKHADSSNAMGALHDFLHHAWGVLVHKDLVSAQDGTLGKEGAVSDPGVRLSTLHGAKGLEFQVVFIVGCEDGRLPMLRSDRREELRLLYVGATRAEEQLFFTWSCRGESFSPNLSPFVWEMMKADRNRCVGYVDDTGKWPMDKLIGADRTRTSHASAMKKDPSTALIPKQDMLVHASAPNGAHTHTPRGTHTYPHQHAPLPNTPASSTASIQARAMTGSSSVRDIYMPGHPHQQAGSVTVPAPIQAASDSISLPNSATAAPSLNQQQPTSVHEQQHPTSVHKQQQATSVHEPQHHTSVHEQQHPSSLHEQQHPTSEHEQQHPTSVHEQQPKPQQESDTSTRTKCTSPPSQPSPQSPPSLASPPSPPLAAAAPAAESRRSISTSTLHEESADAAPALSVAQSQVVSEPTHGNSNSNSIAGSHLIANPALSDSSSSSSSDSSSSSSSSSSSDSSRSSSCSSGIQAEMLKVVVRSSARSSKKMVLEGRLDLGLLRKTQTKRMGHVAMFYKDTDSGDTSLTPMPVTGRQFVEVVGRSGKWEDHIMVSVEQHGITSERSLKDVLPELRQG